MNHSIPGTDGSKSQINRTLCALTVREVEQAIGIPISDWEGRCMEIATLMTEKMAINGKAVYGLWLGTITEGSAFEGRPFTHHGWTRCTDGRIIDPTRWVFEGKEPYIYQGESDYYDEGGVSLKSDKPVPPYNESKKVDYHFGNEHWLYELLLKSSKVSVMQLFYLANLPPQKIGIYARKMYEHIIRAGYEGFVPTDYWDLCDIVEEGC